MKRPALYTFLIFAASIAAARYLKGLYLYVFALAVLLFCLILYEKIKSLSVFILSIAAGVGLLAMGNFSYSHTVEKGTEIVKGTVLDISFNSSGGETVILNNLSFCYKEGEKDIDGRAVIYTAEDTFVKRNDIIAVECDIVPAATVKSISGFDEGEYMLANRLVLSANAKNIFMLGHKKDGPRQMLLNFRDSLGTVADNIYPRYESGIVKAIVMGDTADLPKKARELYTSAGAAHILAVSGLHTAVISIMIMRLLKALRIGIRKASIAAILLLFVYAVFAGARPSVVRSVIMVNTVLAGRLLYRKSDALNSLGASGLCILMANPYSLFNTGFQLSFISVAAVLLFYESWENSGEGLLARVKELALLSASVTVFTFPVLALRFYKVQIYGFITNILIVPFLGILTGMGILSIGLGMVNIGMGRFCGGIVYCLLNYFDIVCGFVSRLPFSNIITGRLPLLFVLAFYGMLFSAVKIKTVNRRRALTAVLTALCVISVLSNRLVFKYSTVSFMPKEYGGGAVIETFDKKIYLIGQTSPNDSFNEAERLCGYINSLGRQYADALILAGTESGDFRLASKLIKLSGVLTAVFIFYIIT